MVRDDDDLDPEDAGHHASMLQNKQQITFNVVTKRKEQLQRWESSEMNGEAPHRRKKPSVRFQDSDIFLSACMSGDEEEVEELLAKGADINTATVDGLTALHQSVIDSKPEMVRFLCEKGADVNAQDNEGWTPLHAAACCGNLPIVKYLCEQGANISIINSDKELALDLADDEGCRDFLDAEHHAKQIVPDDCRDQELTTMMRDAHKWLREGVYGDVAHVRTGATAMHVAAAKGYTQLLELLIKAGGNIRSLDKDGWTPLHAAAHWAERDSCKILMEHGASIKETNNAGQDVLTVAEKEVVEYLEELERAAENRRSLPASGAGVLQDKNARIHHEDHTVSTEHKRELQHRDQSSEKEMMAKVPRLAEKSPTPESSPEESRRVPEKEEERSSYERMSTDRSKSTSETPSVTRSSEEPMSTSSSVSSERQEKSPSVDRSERSTTSTNSSMSSGSSASASSVISSTASNTTASMSTTASSSTPATTSSLHSSDQHVSATVPLSRPLQQPNSWINRGVQLITRSSSSGSTRASADSQTSSQQQSGLSSPSVASPSTPLFSKPLCVPSVSVQRSTSIPSNLPWASLCRTGNYTSPSGFNQLSTSRVSAFRPLVKSHQPLPMVSSELPRGLQPQHLNPMKMRPWQSNAVESEAERRSTARLQRQNRRSTQGVTKEQLEEATKVASEEVLRRRGSTQSSHVGYGASSGTAMRENPILARLASEERDSISMSSDRSDSEKAASSRVGASPRISADRESEKSVGRSSPPTTSATLTLSTAPSPSSTPSAASLRRRSQQGMPLSRSNRRGTGPVLPEDLQVATNRVADAVARSNGLSSTVTRPFMAFNRADPRIGATVPSPQEKANSAPPSTSSPTAPSSAPPLRSAAVAPSPAQRVTSRVAVQPISSNNTSSNYHSSPSTSVFTRPSETNLNYKALYEKERAECERLRREVEDLKKNHDGGSVSAFRSVTSRFRNGTSTLPLGKSPSGGSIDDVDRRSLERKIADLELQVKEQQSMREENSRLRAENDALVRVLAKAVGQLKMENQRLKEENGALVRVISKMTT